MNKQMLPLHQPPLFSSSVGGDTSDPASPLSANLHRANYFRPHRLSSPPRHLCDEHLSVIEEDETDSTCLWKGQLKKQTAVQCLASLANADAVAPPRPTSSFEDAMEMEVEESETSMPQQQQPFLKTPPTSPVTLALQEPQEDDWGHFYIDTAPLGDFSSSSFASPASHFASKRRLSGSKRHRRSHVSKYPRGRCGPTVASAVASVAPAAKQLSCLP